jgi:choline dehydrogenase-like flavoprotein
MAERLDCEVLVIGSGPGGATTAALLAEAGRDVLLVEEGRDWGLDSAPSYSLEEMDQKYRAGGLTTALGPTNITYIEGRCVGGASEINAGLYHRPKAQVLHDWQLTYQIDDFEPDDLWPYFEATEREMQISTHPAGVGPASKKLAQGAERLGWGHREIARFWRYEEAPEGGWSPRRQSMTETMIPRALAAGCRLAPETRIRRLTIKGGEAVAAVGTRGADREPVTIRFKQVFVCCGAVQTPLLLRRSGLKDNIGDALRLHPMVRVAARFPEPFNDPSWGVPVQQVEEFKPELTIGCSHASLPHLALWLEGDVAGGRDALLRRDWERMAIFYIAAVAQGQGRVRSLPFFEDPLVTFKMTDRDLALVGEGLHKLGQLLFAAGAEALFNPLGGGPIERPADLGQLRNVGQGAAQVTTIHLFASCPMGEDRRRCAVDSGGRLHGLRNVWLNDASVLPHSPGVNPQGTIMAVARRNAARFLAR